MCASCRAQDCSRKHSCSVCRKWSSRTWELFDEAAVKRERGRQSRQRSAERKKVQRQAKHDSDAYESDVSLHPAQKLASQVVAKPQEKHKSSRAPKSVEATRVAVTSRAESSGGPTPPQRAEILSTATESIEAAQKRESVLGARLLSMAGMPGGLDDLRSTDGDDALECHADARAHPFPWVSLPGPQARKHHDRGGRVCGPLSAAWIFTHTLVSNSTSFS